MYVIMILEILSDQAMTLGSQVVVTNCGLCSHTVSRRRTLVMLVLRLWQKVSSIALTFKT